MIVNFSTTKATMNEIYDNRGSVSPTLRRLAIGDIHSDIDDGGELYNVANDLMRDADIPSIHATYDKGDYFFMFNVYLDNPTIEIIVDKKGVPIPAGMKSDYKKLDLEELISCYN